MAPAERREHLLGVTERLVLERGASAVMLEDIAESAGVTTQLLYHYFGGRDELFAAMLDAVFARFDDEVASLVQNQPTFEEQIRMLCEQAIDPAPPMRILSAVSGSTAELPRVAEAMMRHNLTAGLFIAGLVQDEYGLEAHRAVGATSAILGMANGFSWTSRAWDKTEAVDFLVAASLATLRCMVEQQERATV